MDHLTSHKEQTRPNSNISYPIFLNPKDTAYPSHPTTKNVVNEC